MLRLGCTIIVRTSTTLIECVNKDQRKSFMMEWYDIDAADIVDALTSKAIDLGFTDIAVDDALAMFEGHVQRADVAWHDHWLLVGPESKPAQLSDGGL
jgi:hypothetical protein